MDSNNHENNKVSEEIARESLIALSDSLPDKILDSNVASEFMSNGCLSPKEDQPDKYRSELISISYLESQDGVMGDSGPAFHGVEVKL